MSNKKILNITDHHFAVFIMMFTFKCLSDKYCCQHCKNECLDKCHQHFNKINKYGKRNRKR